MDEFDALVERIRLGQHPKYGRLTWDRKNREFYIMVTFDRNGESEAEVRARALRYLESLSPEERATLDIDICFREGKPVKATLHIDMCHLSARRLDELSEAA